MEVKPGYKQTEIGVIPEEWEVAELSAVTTQIGDGLHGTPLYSPNGSYFFINGNNLGDGRIVFTNETQTVGRAEFIKHRKPLGDRSILMSINGTIGNLALFNDEPVMLGKSVAFLNVSPSVSKNFIYHSLRAPKVKQQFFGGLTGSTIGNLGLATIRGTKIPLPPSEDEQCAIAEALSDVDGLLGGLDRLIAKKRDLKQAAMQQLLTGQTRLPGFHGEWEEKRLGEVATLNRLNVVPASWPSQTFVHFSLPAFDAGKAPVVELGAAIGSNKFKVPQGAVLVSKLNPRIPRVWAPDVIPEDSIASTEFLVLTPKDGVSRRFLFILCASPRFCEQMELAATGTTGSHQRISPSGALTLKVFVPIDPDEQTAIAEVLSEMDGELAVLEQRREKTRALKQAMMQELLTGRTRLL